MVSSSASKSAVNGSSVCISSFSILIKVSNKFLWHAGEANTDP